MIHRQFVRRHIDPNYSKNNRKFLDSRTFATSVIFGTSRVWSFEDQWYRSLGTVPGKHHVREFNRSPNLVGLFSLRCKKKSRENKLLCWFIKKIILCIRWKALYNSLARVRGEEKKNPNPFGFNPAFITPLVCDAVSHRFTYLSCFNISTL